MRQEKRRFGLFNKILFPLVTCFPQKKFPHSKMRYLPIVKMNRSKRDSDLIEIKQPILGSPEDDYRLRDFGRNSYIERMP